MIQYYHSHIGEMHLNSYCPFEIKQNFYGFPLKFEFQPASIYRNSQFFPVAGDKHLLLTTTEQQQIFKIQRDY